jgi:hypothetical protein
MIYYMIGYDMTNTTLMYQTLTFLNGPVPRQICTTANSGTMRIEDIDMTQPSTWAQ